MTARTMAERCRSAMVDRRANGHLDRYLTHRTVSAAIARNEAEMQRDAGSELTAAEVRDFRRLAGIMVPASAEYRVPGADDDAIFADILKSLGRDRDAVAQGLAMLAEMASSRFAALDQAAAESVAMMFLEKRSHAVSAIGRTVLQCYYRDDRVITALGLEPRAPFPKGHVVEQGDWSLLDKVRGRPRMWRDVDGRGA